eukprot:2433839-Amphidinium_carterae.1
MYGPKLHVYMHVHLEASFGPMLWNISRNNHYIGRHRSVTLDLIMSCCPATSWRRIYITNGICNINMTYITM